MRGSTMVHKSALAFGKTGQESKCLTGGPQLQLAIVEGLPKDRRRVESGVAFVGVGFAEDELGDAVVCLRLDLVVERLCLVDSFFFLGTLDFAFPVPAEGGVYSIPNRSQILRTLSAFNSLVFTTGRARFPQAVLNRYPITSAALLMAVN